MSKSSAPFRFLDLPREIRDNIYPYLFQGSYIIAHVGMWAPTSFFDISAANERRTRYDLSHCSYQLTHTCRQIWNESSALLKGAATEIVIFADDALNLCSGDFWTSPLLKSFLRHVNHLHIVTRGQAITAQFLTKDVMPNLQTINYLIDYSDAILLDRSVTEVCLRLEKEKPETAPSMLGMTRLHLRKQIYGILRGFGRGRDPFLPVHVFLVAPLWPSTKRGEHPKRFGLVASTGKGQNGCVVVAWSEAAIEIGHAEATTLDRKRRLMLDMGAALRTAEEILALESQWM